MRPQAYMRPPDRGHGGCFHRLCVDDLSVCACVGASARRSVLCIVEKTADRIRMPFGIIGRTGPGMRHVVGFGNRLTGRYTFGANLVRAVVTNGDFTAYVCESAVTRPSSHITLGGVVFITSCAVHGYNKNCVLHPRPFR